MKDITCLTAKEFAMKSLKDIQQLSLQTVVAILRDAQEIQHLDLTESIEWIQKQKFPDFILYMSVLGKSVETSLITDANLCSDVRSKTYIPDVFPLQTGSQLPSFCYELFSEIFTDSGRPRYFLVPRVRNGKTYYDLSYSDRKSSADFVVAQKASATVLLLRQILLCFSKAKDLPVVANEVDEINSFIDRVTRDPSKYRFSYVPGLSVVFSYARYLLREFFCPDGDIHPSLAQWESNPFGRHGPGAVAGRERGREKWNFVYDCLRLPRLLYSDVYGTPIGREDEVNSFSSRLVVVPKDFRGHRLICAEPKELQFAQQGLLSVLEGMIRNSRLTNGHICLDDQDPSFYLSRSLKFGTIDLKDASDRITLRLLKILLPEQVYKLVTRFRSDSIILPDGRTIKQYDTAFTMGNALCFPMETLVFWSLCLATIMTRGGSYARTFNTPLEECFRTRLRVFGDDIIVPIEWVRPVKEFLTAAGLVVNTDKTCELALVRESCGSWWYAGYDCRITKLKYAVTRDLLSWTSFQDVIPRLRENGLLNMASVLETFCRLIYPTPEMVLRLVRDADALRLPEVGGRSPSWIDLRAFVRYNKSLQRLEYRSPMRCTDDIRAYGGRIGYTAWATNAAIRYLNTNSQRVKFRWVGII